jgi:hypothetical protein
MGRRQAIFRNSLFQRRWCAKEPAFQASFGAFRLDSRLFLGAFRLRKTALLIIVVALFASFFVFLIDKPASTSFEVYGGDSNGTSMNWGANLFPGFSVNRSFCLRNTGIVPITIGYKTIDWQPLGISSYLNLTWDYNGALIYPGQEIKITMTLQSSRSMDFADYLLANSITSYVFSIEIYASTS